jgi:hypothetical protein
MKRSSAHSCSGTIDADRQARLFASRSYNSVVEQWQSRPSVCGLAQRRGAASLVLHETSTLYFESELGTDSATVASPPGSPKRGVSGGRARNGLLTDASGFP